MLRNAICHMCDDAHATAEVKACCSHLVPICDDCDRRVVQHQKCRTCSGILTPEEDRMQADAYMASLEPSMYDIDDDLDQGSFYYDNECWEEYP